MMRSVRATLAAALFALDSLPSLALDRAPPAQVFGPIKAPSINLTGTDSTGVISGMSAKRPGGVSRLLSDILDNSLDVRDFGARDDDATDNTGATQAAVDAAAGKKRVLNVTASAGGTGKYRVGPNIDWKNVNVRFDEGAGFVNLDGSKYTGASYAGFFGLDGVFNPQISTSGRRVSSPGRSAVFLNTTRPAHETFTVYNGTSPFPYDVLFRERAYSLLGQNAPSSGSWAGLSEFANVYNMSNGPGVIITCDATNGSQILGNCTPDPTANQTYNMPDGTTKTVVNVFSPAQISMVSGSGVPANTFLKGWNSNTLEMAQGTDTVAQPFTGANGRYQFRVVSGRTEFNPITAQILPVGTTAAGGPKGGMNWYNEFASGTNISTNPADQEGALFPVQVNGTKMVPGNLRDRLHNGSALIAAQVRPDQNYPSYPLDDGLTVTGWSGPPGLAGGGAPGATYGAVNGIRVGGICTGIYCNAPDRSYFKFGISVQDYETGISLTRPAPANSGTAIFIDAGAGNIDLRDNLIVGGRIRETTSQTPASATAACSVGTRAWDANYEYRCVATNTWKRAALSTW